MMNRRGAASAIAWAVLIGAGVLSAVAFAAEPGAAPGPCVRLIVDYGDGVEKRYACIAWREGMNVRSALEAASALPPPRGLTFDSKGEGERTILRSIDGLKNEGAGASARNWLFWVNGSPGERSYAVTELKAGDEAAWRFATYDALRATDR